MSFSFDRLPFNTLVGADRKTFDRVTEGVKIDNKGKYLLTKCCQRILSPLYNINTREYNAMAKPEIVSPLFIIGHWRSGTTFVHNVLSRDPQFGYCTTYQTVFPHMMLYGSSFFKRLAGLCMPKTRPTDNLELSVEQPQEEEFALTNMTPAAYYHFWSLPNLTEKYRDKYLFLESCTAEERAEFCEATKKMIHIALHCQNKSRFLSKNPPHTARIALLHRMFPDAKFIYLVRNPYSVFESTVKFFNTTIAPLTLQKVSTEQVEQNILTTYRKMIDVYNRDRQTISVQNLFQMRFEDFEADPIAMSSQIYRSLNLGDFDSVRPEMERYVASKKRFQKNKYNYSAHTIEMVNHYCAATLNEWGYSYL